MSASLVGSEMCIRDRIRSPPIRNPRNPSLLERERPGDSRGVRGGSSERCLLYTSDAADDM
eukprot:4524021-Alexandrium_andersonii.AAC.1